MKNRKSLIKVLDKERNKLSDLIINRSVNQLEIYETTLKIRNIERRLGYGS